MKRLLKTTPDPSRARIQHQAFVDLLNSTTDLKEREHVLPFFGNSLDLAFLFSHYIPAIINADRIATEFQIYGDFKADLIVGDSSQGKYLLVEFENGSANSVFKSNKKAIPDWGAFRSCVLPAGRLAVEAGRYETHRRLRKLVRTA